MRIGALRQRIDIQRPVVVGSTGSGAYEPNTEWEDWKTNVPCSVSVRRGQEHFLEEGKKRYSKDVYYFSIRYLSADGINSTYRVKHRGNIFDIRHVRPDAQYGREMVLECEVHDAQIGTASLSASILQPIPTGIVGSTYSGFTITVTGGTAPYTFAEDSPGMAPGLSLDASTGTITGTPTAAGEWPCDVVVTDAAGNSVSLSFAISVGSEPETFSFTMTAGQDDDWVGYMPGSFGLISGQPVADSELISVVMAKPSSGEGGIEIQGNQYNLQQKLSGKDVWVAGNKIANPDGWSYAFNVATWWVVEGFPAMTSGQSYLIEIK